MKHIVQVISNNETVPYFNWFAEASADDKEIKFSFIALCKHKPQMIEEVGKFNCNCYWIPFDDSRRKLDWMKATLKLYSLLKKIKPDIVHAHLFDDAVPLMVASFFLRIKKRVVTKADTGFHWNYAKKGVILDRLVNFLATDLVAISEESLEFIIEKEKANCDKISFIHHGIKIDPHIHLISAGEKQKFIEQHQLSGKIVIGVISRLVVWKGHKYIIEAALEFCKKYTNSVFIFIGTGDQKEELLLQVKENNLEKYFIFLDQVSPSKLVSIFETFTIFLHAANMEPFGFVIPEAMAHSLPIVATNSGSARDGIIHKKNGYLVESKNSTQIREGLEWILEHNVNKELNKEAFKTVHKMYDFNLMYTNHKKLYLKSEKGLNHKLTKKHVVMIIANSPNPSYFKWFAEFNDRDDAFKLSYVFLHTFQPELTSKLNIYNVRSYWIYFNTHKWKPLQYIKSFVQLFILFLRIKPDVIQTNLFDDSLPALLAAKLIGIKKRVITKQDTGYHILNTPNIVKFDRFNNKNATHLIACSQESMDYILNDENGERSKTYLIHHGVDENLITNSSPIIIKEIKDKYQLHGKLVIGTIARYIKLKGYEDIIEAAREVVKINQNIVFLGIGAGLHQSYFEEKIIEYNLQNHFILTGFVDYKLIPSFYACFNIYVHAAQFEPFGFVIAEAMFNKVALITTNVGAARDVLNHKENAYIINFGAPNEIAEGVNYLLRIDSSAMVNSAYELAKANFTSEQMWTNYKNIFLN